MSYQFQTLNYDAAVVRYDLESLDSYYNEVQYYKRSISIIKCQYVLKQFSVFKKFNNKFTYNFVKTYTFIFCIFSSNTLQKLMFVCHTVLELCFYGCCHPCFFMFNNFRKFTYLLIVVSLIFKSELWMFICLFVCVFV